MSEKYIVIGDIHGCLDQLNEILYLTKSYKDHKLIFLGDYIDRGPDSECVIKRIKDLDAIFLLGNHEEMFLSKTSESLSQVISEESIEWIKSETMIVFETDSYIFTHAGLNKSKSLSEQTTRDYLWVRELSDYYDMTSKIVVHGHTTVDTPEIVGNRININTGCGSSGYLTALILPEMEFIKSSKSPGDKKDWQSILKELENELAEYDNLEELEEIID